MNKDEIKDRLSKVRPRLSNLFERYPIVTLSVLLAGVILGFVLGKVL